MNDCFSQVKSVDFDKSFLDAMLRDARVNIVNRLSPPVSNLGIELIGLVLIGLISPRGGMPI
jgi:hypothetical protein